MAQVSKRLLSKNVEQKMFSIFFTALAQLSKPSDIRDFILDFLGPVEQKMLAKRLGIAVLLTKGYSYSTIKDILKVSQGTIARVNVILSYRGKGYSLAVKRILRDESFDNLSKIIEDATIKILPKSSIKSLLRRQRDSTGKPKTALG